VREREEKRRKKEREENEFIRSSHITSIHFILLSLPPSIIFISFFSSVFLSLYLSIDLSIYLSVYLYLYIYLSFFPSILLTSFLLYIYLSLFPPSFLTCGSAEDGREVISLQLKALVAFKLEQFNIIRKPN
jgi:type III secretory pathway component EscV